MSVNITVNGSFGKRCNKPLVRQNLEEEDKEILAEKRKQRIIQVREQSKDLARKLREDVAREKHRQLQKFNEMKAKEMQVWETQALSKMKEDYRAGFSHVGAAHRAAKKENEQRLAKEKKQTQSACGSAQLRSKPNAAPRSRLPPFSQVGAAYYAPSLGTSDQGRPAGSKKLGTTGQNPVSKRRLPEQQPSSSQIHGTHYTANQSTQPCETAQPSRLCSNLENQRNRTNNMQPQLPSLPQSDVTYHPSHPCCYSQACSSLYAAPTRSTLGCVALAIPQPRMPCANAENWEPNDQPQQPYSSRMYAAYYTENLEKKRCSRSPTKKSAPRISSKAKSQPEKSKSAPQKSSYRPPGRTVTAAKKPSERRTQPSVESQKADEVPPQRPILKTQTTHTQTEADKQDVASKPSSTYTHKTSKVTIMEPECSCCECSESESDEYSSEIFVDSCEASTSDNMTDKISEEQEEYSDDVRQSHSSHPCHNRGVVLDLDVDKDDVVTITTPRTCMPPQGQVKTNKLRQTPAVLLDLDVERDDIVTITTPYEIKDHFAENNRQFSSVIRVSPPCKPSKQKRKTYDASEFEEPDIESDSTSLRTSKQTSEMASKTTSESSPGRLAKSATNQPRQSEKKKQPTSSESMQSDSRTSAATGSTSQEKARASTSEPTSQTASRTTTDENLPEERRPRFTQISELLQKSSSASFHHARDTLTILADKRRKTAEKSTDTTAVETDVDPPPQPPPSGRSQQAPTSKRVTYETTDLTRCKDSTELLRNKMRAESLSRKPTQDDACSGKSVQFYDYNNKFSKTYQQPVEAVRVQPKNQNQPNAREQAIAEQQRQSAREKKSDDLRKKSDERGKKAIEREQVRRDCNELTQKLEALSQQHTNLLPVQSNPVSHQRMQDAAARREVKMNSAIEEILMRPAVITCPEVGQQCAPPSGAAMQAGTKTTTASNCVNLGAPTPVSADNDGSATSSDSCRSILLGYVNDQSRQLQKDLSQYDANPQQNQEKSKRLQALLERIEQLRGALMAELQSSGTANANVEKVEKVIDSISAVRKERERILIDDIAEQRIPQIQQREKELLQKEAHLENKAKELNELHKDAKESGTLKSDADNAKKSVVTTSDSATRRFVTGGDKPVEIVIKVCNMKSEVKCKCMKSPRRTISPRKPATLKLHSPFTKKKTKLTTVAKPKPKVQSPRIVNSTLITADQTSYNSTSTSYMSLPPKIDHQMDAVVGEIQGKRADQQISTQPTADQHAGSQEEPRRPLPHLNPLVAHYVQRLLGMSRNSIVALGVSSSEIQTPSSSVINTTTNRSGLEDEIISNEHIGRVQRFIEDNRTFVSELEESLRGKSSSDASLESTLKAFEEIWRQKLCGSSKCKQQPTASAKPDTQSIKPAAATAEKPKCIKAVTYVDAEKRQKTPPKAVSTTVVSNYESLRISASSPRATKTKEKIKRADLQASSHLQLKGSLKKPQQKEEAAKKAARPTIDQSSETDSARTQPDFARYAQLTENCTQRIAELTELITRVREEKQKILESTLSTVSDNGCNPTEYEELPNTEAYIPLRSSPLDRRSPDSTSTEKPMPLEKDRHIGVSKDSGISESRPLTAQEHLTDLMEPNSTNSSRTPSALKQKPPPTLTRFSPQLVEDEVVHELSTIPEVDTPATSQVNTSLNPSSTALPQVQQSIVWQKFPTFEQYMLQLDVDLTAIDPNESERLKKDFESLKAAMIEARENPELRIREFPSFRTYVRTVLSTEDADELITLSDSSPNPIDELLANLTRPNFSAEGFPTISEYIRRIASNTAARELIDSASLADVSSGDHSSKRTRSENQPDPIDELLANLTRPNLSVEPFPDIKEYMQRIASTTAARELIDSASLANVSNDSDSINIEEELRRRNILENAFRRTPCKKDDVFSSTGRSGVQQLKERERIFGRESGIEKLSSSTTQSGDLERDLRDVGIRWAAAMHRRHKEAEALSSSSTSRSTPKCPNGSPKRQAPRTTCAPNTSAAISTSTSTSGTRKTDDCSQEFGRGLSLRDFLAKELLKQSNVSSSTSTSEDSLRNHFLQNVIGTLTPTDGTPRTAVPTSRQKTSTPVASRSEQSKSSSATLSAQLFSGESRISSVRYQSSPTQPKQCDDRGSSEDDKNPQ